MHLLLVDRRTDKITIGTKGPAVVDAFVYRRIAVLTQGHAHAPMGTHVQCHMDLAVAVTLDNHQILAHGSHHVIIGGSNF